MERRDFLKNAGIVGAGLASGLSIPTGLEARLIEEAEKEQIRERANLYNIQLGAFETPGPAENMATRIRRTIDNMFPNLGRLVDVHLDNDGLYKTFIDAKMIGSHAEHVASNIRDRGVERGAYKRLVEVPFTPSIPLGANANFIMEDSLPEMVMRYMTAYSSEVPAITGILREAYELADWLSGEFRTPRPGSVFPVPISLLKPVYQSGAVEGQHFMTADLESGDTVDRIVSMYTEPRLGLENNRAIIMRANKINPGQERDLAVGTRLVIPMQIYKSPLQPTIMTEEATPRLMRPVIERTAVEEVLEERIPEIASTGNYSDLIMEIGHLTVLKGESPSAMIEAFNLQNWEQMQFYNNDNNLRQLAEAYGRGILAYQQNHKPDLEKVIIDLGHGTTAPGAVDFSHGTGKTETHYAQRLHDHLVAYMQREGPRRGLEIIPLVYDGVADEGTRVRWYQNQANAIADGDDSVYISVHINSHRSQKPLGPDMVILGKSRRDPRLILSEKLANEMLAQTRPWYQMRMNN
ncbi:N-acetylmuramoyl-L-alanine amidase [Nanoarchaeota archaeon]